MVFRKTLLSGLLTIPCLLAPAAGRAQESANDLLIHSIAQRERAELEAVIRTPPPAGNDRHELSIYQHRRGHAHYRLGQYALAAAELRQALANNSPSRLAPGDWGDRLSIQNDLANSLRENSDLIENVDLLRAVAKEQQGSNSYAEHWAHARLVWNYAWLGDFTGAVDSVRRANDLLPALANTRNWGSARAVTLYLNYLANARVLSWQSRHSEAERMQRLAVDLAQDDLRAQRAVLPAGHRRLNQSYANVALSFNQLAELLGERGKFGEAEYAARASFLAWSEYLGGNSAPGGNALRSLCISRLQ